MITILMINQWLYKTIKFIYMMQIEKLKSWKVWSKTNEAVGKL